VRKLVDRELDIVFSVKHENIVDTLGWVKFSNHEKIGIVMELADQGTLATRMEADDLMITHKLNIGKDVVSGLEYLHSVKIIHRDVKPQNILLFKRGNTLTAKLADFGVSKVMDHKKNAEMTKLVGSLKYMAPEIAQEGRYDEKVDIFSLSLVFYEMFTHMEPYPGVDSVTKYLAAKITSRAPFAEFPRGFPPNLQQMITRGAHSDENIRPTLQDFRAALMDVEPGQFSVQRAIVSETVMGHMMQLCSEVIDQENQVRLSSGSRNSEIPTMIMTNRTNLSSEGETSQSSASARSSYGYVTLQDIDTWVRVNRTKRDAASKISLWKGNLVHLKIDAIVVPTNTRYLVPKDNARSGIYFHQY
jgi:serine/threonine protein kinase